MTARSSRGKADRGTTRSAWSRTTSGRPSARSMRSTSCSTAAPHGDLSTAKIDAAARCGLERRERRPGAHARPAARNPATSAGDAVIERRFKLPHIAHAPHEPVNATASYRDGKVEVWGPIQSVTACQEAVAEAASGARPTT